jgi:1,4-dihydroxy-6-naphthoate synthase
MIRLAFSPCPNDTFIFYALVHKKIELEGLEFAYHLEDVETLNHLALKGSPDMVKVSFHAWLYLRDRYQLLESGSALGFGNGPLLVSSHPIPAENLAESVVAIPGAYTTAHLLLNYAIPGIRKKKIMVFSEIEDAILEGKADAGVIIHENRFTYMKRGLQKIMDLGEFWERSTGSPVPLGGIIARKELGKEILDKLERIMRRSVQYAFDHPAETMEFVRQHAQEMNEDVMKKHIALYVTEFTLSLGEKGHSAIRVLSENAGNLTSKLESYE